MNNSRIELVHRFFSGTGSSYDRVVMLNTFGMDLWWKKKILGKIPDGALRILDQGCGTGILTLRIARKFPRCRVTGVELREEYLSLAREKAKALKISNVDFILGRAEEVLLDGAFDCVTSSYLAKYVELEPLIRNIGKMLRPGGVLAMHDFTYPSNRTFARVWEFYFRLLQTAGSWKFPEWREVYERLPEFLRESSWVAELTRILAGSGFSRVRVEPLTWGTSALVTARKDQPRPSH